MDVELAISLLGGLSPQTFMRRHWHKRPLLVRSAISPLNSPLSRTELFELAGQQGVESRLVSKDAVGHWQMRPGPFTRRQLPSPKRRDWTLLVQGVDLHVQGAHELLSRFRFVPDARLDDLMVSYASDGGGVGPHVDSYDVFLLQVQGRRRWKIGRNAHPVLVHGAPLKLLANFVAEEEWLLEPGDMLYLPPHWAHEGVAEGECMTCSIGFRAASRDETSREVLQHAIDAANEESAESGLPDPSPRYRDPRQLATQSPARLPAELQDFARRAVQRFIDEPASLNCALGEWLSEPKLNVWFDGGGALRSNAGIRLDRRTRMLYDERHIFINGEAFRAGGRDATLMRRLADARHLSARDLARASEEARALLDDWADAGWIHADVENTMQEAP